MSTVDNTVKANNTQEETTMNTSENNAANETIKAAEQVEQTAQTEQIETEPAKKADKGISTWRVIQLVFMSLIAAFAFVGGLLFGMILAFVKMVGNTLSFVVAGIYNTVRGWFPKKAASASEAPLNANGGEQATAAA